jgi:probable FeS assembly SUF system protein SufT
MNDPVTLTRDCPAVLIPAGDPVALKAGETVHVTQALGGSYTVYLNGNLLRIASSDADALGYEPVQELAPSTVSADGRVDETQVWDQLRTCYDPEIPFNIVELGLIYDCSIEPLAEGGNRVDVRMTLTAPGCGMGEILVDDVRNKIAKVPNVTDVNVDLVFDPPWNQEMMSEAARLQTGMY